MSERVLRPDRYLPQPRTSMGTHPRGPRCTSPSRGAVSLRVTYSPTQRRDNVARMRPTTPSGKLPGAFTLPNVHVPFPCSIATALAFPAHTVLFVYILDEVMRTPPRAFGRAGAEAARARVRALARDVPSCAHQPPAQQPTSSPAASRGFPCVACGLRARRPAGQSRAGLLSPH